LQRRNDFNKFYGNAFKEKGGGLTLNSQGKRTRRGSPSDRDKRKRNVKKKQQRKKQQEKESLFLATKQNRGVEGRDLTIVAGEEKK